MTPKALVAFRDRLGMNKSAFAEALGIDRKTLNRLEASPRAVPRYIALACSALAHGLPPME